MEAPTGAIRHTGRDRLLTEAGNLQLRGEWAEAAQRCLQAIALDPDHPGAHILLGDIYAAQGKHREALLSYRAALEIVDDDVLRLKVDELEERVRAGARLPKPAALWPRKRRKLVLSRRTGLVAAGAGLLILLLIFAALWAARTRQPSEVARPGIPPTTVGRAIEPRPAAPARATTPLTPPMQRPATPVAGPSAFAAPPPSGQPARASAPYSPAQPAAPRPRYVQRPTSLQGPLTDRERAIVYELSQLELKDGNPIGTYVSAILSPRDEHLTISFEIPDEVEARPTPDYVLYEANRLAVTAAEVNRSLEAVTVRVIIGYTDRVTGARHTVDIFEGETSRDLLSAALAEKQQGKNYNCFVDQWWNPEYWQVKATNRPPLEVSGAR